MEELKKEVAELKDLVSKLLEIQISDYHMKYGYLNKQIANSRQKN